MSLHVVQLGPYPPPEGGITRNMMAIRGQLEADGGRSTIIATSKSDLPRSEPDVYHPRSSFDVLRLLNRLECDVLHLHVGGDITPRVLLLSLACSFFGGSRSVLTLHSGGYAASDAGKAAKPNSFAGFVFRRFAKIIAVNDQLAAVFRKFGVADEKLCVIAPYSSKKPDPSIKLPSELAEFCKEHSPLLVSVGGLEPEYEPFLQIDALKQIVGEYPKAGLMIIGGGSLKAHTQTYVGDSGYPDSIMLAGNIEHNATLRLIEKADAMLRITQFDGDAISVREGLFLGTPVIATDNGMRPVGVNLIERGSRKELIEAVKRIVSEKTNHDGATSMDDGMPNIREVIDLYDGLAADTLKDSVEAVAD
jgi:glycosyltransferase involved in cell wall biosynthesis